MIRTHTRRSAFLTAAVASATALIASSAHAGFVAEPLHFSINVSGESGFAFAQSYEAPPTFEIGGGQFAYQILVINNATFQFNPTVSPIANGTPTATTPAGIFTGFAFQNKSSENLQVTVTYLLETNFSALAGVVPWETNASIAVNANTTITPLLGSPLWQATIDGLPVGNLFADPSGLSGSTGPASDDQGQNGLALAPMSTIAITMTFDITPGGQASFNGNFFVIPAPGSMALLAIGGFLAVGRRRRN